MCAGPSVYGARRRVYFKLILKLWEIGFSKEIVQPVSQVEDGEYHWEDEPWNDVYPLGPGWELGQNSPASAAAEKQIDKGDDEADEPLAAHY